MEYGEALYELIVNPILKKEYRKYLDLLYIEIESEKAKN